jgi:hypothetical protein
MINVNCTLRSYSHSIVPDLGNALIKRPKAQCRTGSTVFSIR